MVPIELDVVTGPVNPDTREPVTITRSYGAQDDLIHDAILAVTGSASSCIRGIQRMSSDVVGVEQDQLVTADVRAQTRLKKTRNLSYIRAVIKG
jgi:hypothetical protein